nr:zinc finger MYM-type protein 5-like [Hydra vulgaris]
MELLKSKSGFQKRKLKKQKEALNKFPKLDKFIIKNINNNQESTPDDASIECECYDELNILEKSYTEVIACKSTKADCSDGEIKKISDEIVDTEDAQEVLTGINEKNIIYTNTTICSDLGKYLNQNISDETKRLLISIPGHRPKGPFPKDPSQQNRSFSETYYYTTSNYGPVPRLWICYSSMLDAVYCQPCWLFSSIKNQWQSGIKDWKYLSQKIKMHSSSQHRIDDCAVLELWKKNKTIDK